jgi:hypothetical protein
MPAYIDPSGTYSLNRISFRIAIVIAIETGTSRSTNWRRANHPNTAINPTKMFRPILLTRIEKSDCSLSFRIDRRDNIATAFITTMTSQGQIIDIIRTLARSRLNMINCEAIGA